MNLKKQMKINHIIYLYLIKELGNTERHFIDSLVHIYRIIRLDTDWRIDKSFVSYDYKVVDTDKNHILESLSFFGLINPDYSLTTNGEEYLQNELRVNDTLNNVVSKYKKDFSNKIAYENTCLSSSSPTAANCGLCKNVSCNQKTNLFGVFSQYLRVPNYQRSFSKA